MALADSKRLWISKWANLASSPVFTKQENRDNNTQVLPRNVFPPSGKGSLRSGFARELK